MTSHGMLKGAQETLIIPLNSYIALNIFFGITLVQCIDSSILKRALLPVPIHKRAQHPL